MKASAFARLAPLGKIKTLFILKSFAKTAASKAREKKRSFPLLKGECP